MKYTNFAEFFKSITTLYGERGVIFFKEGDKYSSISGNKLKELVYYLASAMNEFKLKPGDKAAIISESRFEWVVTDFACILNQLVSVPIYTTMTPKQIQYILKHSESKLCFVSTKLIAEKVLSVSNELTDLIKIISYNKPESDSEVILSFEDLIYNSLVLRGESYSNQSADKLINESSSKTKPDDLLTVIYTSGTTGIPKGVCLTHKNILSNIESCQKAFPDINTSDRCLSFLPLAHSYERTAGYYFNLACGAQIYYAQSMDTLRTQMQEVKPTLMTSVPQFFKRVYTNIFSNINTQSLHRRILVKTAFTLGRKKRAKKNSGLWKAADKIVFRKIKERTGGCLKFFISGGSALNKEIAEFFDSIGLTILEGYGMTEASPVISVNKLNKNKFGSVGLPLENVQVKIAEDGEILVRGDNVMKGYYKNETDTSQTIIDSWLHTGDIGHIDQDGFLFITDRKKALIKTEGGKYISLTHIEETLSNSKYIEQIITFAGDDKHFVSALIYPNLEEINREFPDMIDKSSIELISDKQIFKFIEKEISEAQKHLPKYERVRKFTLIPKPFSIESGELTPTLKLKRKVIEEMYKTLIDDFYKLR